MIHSDAELARMATGPHALEAFPPEHVICPSSTGVALTVGGIDRGGEIFARCPTGQEVWLSAADFGRALHFVSDATARCAALGVPAKAAERTARAALKRPAVTQSDVERLERKLKEVSRLEHEARAITAFHVQARVWQQEVAMQEAWRADPRGTAIKCLAVLGSLPASTGRSSSSAPRPA